MWLGGQMKEKENDNMLNVSLHVLLTFPWQQNVPSLNGIVMIEIIS